MHISIWSKCGFRGISNGLVECFNQWRCLIRLAGSEEEEEEGEWKLYFKLYCFLDVESMPEEGVEFAFMFEQVSFHTQHLKRRNELFIAHYFLTI